MRLCHCMTSRFVRVAGTNDEIDGTTITESNSGEVTHVGCRQSTDAQRLGQSHYRCVDQAQMEVRITPVRFHTAAVH